MSAYVMKPRPVPENSGSEREFMNRMLEAMDRNNQVFRIAECFGNIESAIAERAARGWDDIVADFLRVLDGVLRDCEKKQAEGRLGKIRYITISCLRSSAVTGSHEFQISGWDGHVFISEYPAVAYWSPAFVFENVEEEFNTLYGILCNNGTRQLKGVALREYKLYVYRLYYDIARRYFAEMVKSIDLNSCPRTALDRTVEILYGPYAEGNMLLGKFIMEN